MQGPEVIEGVDIFQLKETAHELVHGRLGLRDGLERLPEEAVMDELHLDAAIGVNVRIGHASRHEAQIVDEHIVDEPQDE